jgi:hypothetical protein
MKHLKIYNLFSKETKMFESVVGDNLPDILLEINDERYWKANCWTDSQNGKWIIIIETVCDDEEYELEGQTPTPIVIETIERSIDFMNGEGFINYVITFEASEDQYEEINLEDVPDLDVWSYNFIRIEFWK